MLGIEISTDFLIIAILIQLIIIAILIILIFFKLNKFSRSSPSSHSSAPSPPLLPPPLPVDLELDKKIEKKLADMQIKLDEISTELSITKKDQNKSIANLATLLADTVNTATATAATIAASATAPIISSGLFDRYSDTDSITKSEFLELDLDSSSSSSSSPSSANESSTKSKIIDYDRTPVIDLENSNLPAADAGNPDAPSIVSASTVISPPHLNSNGHIHQSVNDDSINKNIRFSKYYQSPDQYTNDQLNHHFNNSQHISCNMINGQRTKDEHQEETNFITQNENQNQNPNNKLEGLHLSNEKISNPEIDVIDKEILSALQRLGEVDYTNSNNNNEQASKKNDRLNDSHT